MPAKPPTKKAATKAATSATKAATSATKAATSATKAATTGDATVTCAWCGTTAPSMPLTWTSSTERDGRVRRYCDRCARENLRAIEGRLDSEWW